MDEAGEPHFEDVELAFEELDDFFENTPPVLMSSLHRRLKGNARGDDCMKGLGGSGREKEREMNKKIVAALIATALILAACQDQQFQDIEAPESGVGEDLVMEEGHLTFQALDQIDVFQNLDGFPSMVRVCLEGLAFLMVSATWYDAVSEKRPYERMPVWDTYCEERG